MSFLIVSIYLIYSLSTILEFSLKIVEVSVKVLGFEPNIDWYAILDEFGGRRPYFLRNLLI